LGAPYRLTNWPGWLCGSVVERRSLASELPGPALDLQLISDHSCG